MKPKITLSRRWASAMLLATLSLACTLPSIGAPPTPTLYVIPTLPPTPIPPTATPTPEVLEPTQPAALLDLCTLITPEEAAQVLGGEVEAQPAQSMGNCMYRVTTPFEGQTIPMLSISAAQGEEAKTLMLIGVSTLMFLTGDPSAQQRFEELQAQAESMTVEEVVAASLPEFAAVGYTTVEESGADDTTYWLYNEQFQVAEIITIRDDTLLSISLIGLTSPSLHDTTLSLTETAFARLPASFSVLPEGPSTLTP